MQDAGTVALRRYAVALFSLSAFCAPVVLAADDVPDLNGVWLAGGQAGGGGGRRQRPQVTAAAQLVMDEYDLLVDDPAYECSPASISRAAANPTPSEIEQLDDRVILRHEYMDVVRTIYIDGRDHSADTDPSVVGHSIGHFEGSDLVIETTGFAPSYISTVTGIPQTETLQATERLSLAEDGSILQIALRFTDPATFTSPWTITRSFRRAPNMTLLEFGCVLEDAGYETE